MNDTSQNTTEFAQTNSFAFVENLLLDLTSIRNDLPQAILNKQLDVYYQPQVNVKERTCSSLEALARWKHPRFGFISPETFIPIVEELGLIDELTTFVIQRVAIDVSEWRQAGLQIDAVSVNISARLLASHVSARRLLQLLKSVVTVAPYIILELTESAMVRNVAFAHSYLEEFSNLGYEIGLDDFGVGYSSLAYLLEFPIDVIKIDRRFVSTLKVSAKARAIVRAVVALAEGLDMDVIAEGVERAEELELLKSLGCNLIQGFYFSQPLPAEQIAAFLTERRMCT